MRPPGTNLALMMLAAILTGQVPAWAQQGPPTAPASPAAASALVSAPEGGAPLLTPDQLDRLLEPYAGAPQDALGVVLDACRSPATLLEAAQWTRAPATSRGTMDEAWPPAVRIMAERAPHTLDYLTQNIAICGALGSAYQRQPNDVWLAFGRVTMAREASNQQGEAAAPASTPRPPAVSQAAPGSGSPVVSPPPVAAAPNAPSSQTTAPVLAPTTDTVVVPAPQVVAPPAAVESSSVSSALVGGVVGLGAGLLISELVRDNDDWHAPGYGYGYRPPYAVPPPYAPYRGASPGVRYDAARSLQDDRQAAARERQDSRQSFAAGQSDALASRQTQRQQTAQSQRAERQAGRPERQQAAQARQQQRQVAVQQRQQTGPSRTAGSQGPERRAAATSGAAQRPSPAALQQRAAAPRPAAAPARPRPEPRAARPPDWGPARGMSGGAEISRSRAPSGGNAAARGGGRAAGAGGGRRR